GRKPPARLPCRRPPGPLRPLRTRSGGAPPVSRFRPVWPQLLRCTSVVKGRSLFRVPRSEGEEHIPRRATEHCVAGSDKDHAIGHDGTRSADRATVGLHSIDRIELTHGLEGPQESAVSRGDCLYLAVGGPL